MHIKKSKIRNISILVILVFGLGTSSPAHAAKIEVGAELGHYDQPHKRDCDLIVPSKPYRTIQSAIAAATAGDTVCVKDGTYKEDIVIDKPLRLSGEEADDSIIKGQTPGGTVTIAADNVTLEGFTIKGAGSDYSHTAVLIGEGRSDVMVQYNHIKAGSGALALRADGGQEGITIQHNILEGTNSPQIVLINGQPSTGKPSNDIVVRNNAFVGSVNKTSRDDTGIALISQATNNQVTRNVFKAKGDIQELVQCAYSSNTINENNFTSATFSDLAGIPVKVRAASDSPTNAEANWWGDTDPSDNVQGTIDYLPFATKAYKEK